MKLQFGCGPRFERFSIGGDEMAKPGTGGSVVSVAGRRSGFYRLD